MKKSNLKQDKPIRMKKGWKKRINIILSVLLVIGVLSSGFGGYIFAQSLNEKPAETGSEGNAAGEKQNNDSGEVITQTDIPGGEGLTDTMTLRDDVRVFANDAAKKINSCVTSIEIVGNNYESGEQLEIKFSKSQSELFGDLSYGDTFVLEGDSNTPFGETYILKVENIYETDGGMVMRTSQPYFDEIFDEISLNLDEPLQKENLVASFAAPGVELRFGKIEEEFDNPDSIGGLDASEVSGVGAYMDSRTATIEKTVSGLDSAGELSVQPIATEVKTEPFDLIFDISYDIKKTDPKDDTDSKTLELDADTIFKINGKIGIKNLSAYMVCDMPEPLRFNELFVGVRGEKTVNVSVEAGWSASFNGKPTEKKGDILGIDIKATGLNEKLIPLGVWQFVGTTPIHISNAQYKDLRIAPSIFFMLYSDWEGKIEFKAVASFEYKHAFNGGLRVVKDGKPTMNMENYPYNTGNSGEASDKSIDWSIGLYLDANTDLTLLGGSVLFCIGGLNIGEISLMRIGMEAECKLELSISSKEGAKTINSQDSTYYLRLYVKVGEIKVRLKADINIFWHDWGFEFGFECCLLDMTLWEKGNKPDKFKPVTPVSTIPYPEQFDSAITIVCDVSGSMDEGLATGETKLVALKKAGTVITEMMKDFSVKNAGNHGIGVVQFSGSAKTLAFPHIDYPFIDDCIQSMGDGGGTNIVSGLEFGIEQLNNIDAKSKVIILMTDGQSGDHPGILKQAEDAKTKGIRVFTIGFGSNADENILKQIADATDGEYRFADTDNLVGIIGSFMYAKQASDVGTKVLADLDGVVAQGETTSAKSFTVPDESGNLNTILYWPGSVLKLILIDPNERTVDENYPGAVVNNSTIPATLTISNPLPGSWKMKVKGIETSPEYSGGEPYYAITSFKEVKLNAEPELEPLKLIGAYCLPIGFSLTLMCVMLFVFVNVKPKSKKESQRKAI